MLEKLWQYCISNKQQVILPFFFSALFIVPFFMTGGAMYGDDLYFHLNRMLTFESIFKSPVNFNYFYGVGQGVNYFYPWLTFYPYYILYHITKNLYASWLLYLYGLNLLTYVIGYKCTRNLTNNSSAGHIFAVLYLFSGYRLINIAVRFTVGEMIAMTFIPLAFYGFYHVLKGNYAKWYWLSIGITLIVYSHILSVLMTGEVFAVIFLIFFWFTDEKLERITSLMLAVLAMIAMSAFQLFTMLQQVLSNELAFPGRIRLDDTTFSVRVLIINSLKNNLTSYVFGLSVLLLFVFLLFKLTKFSKEDIGIFVLSLLLMFWETKWCNWTDNINGLIASIQFVWRLNAYITLFIVYLGAKYLAKMRLNKRGFMVLVTVTVLISGVSQYRCYEQRWDNAADASTELSSRTSLDETLNISDTIDYTNKSLNEDDAFQDRENKAQHKVFLEETQEEVDATISHSATFATVTLDNDNSKSQAYELPFYKYSGQVVTVDGEEEETAVSDQGSTTVWLPSGRHTIVISYHYTVLSKISAFFSFLSILAMSCLTIFIILHRLF